MSNEEVPSKEEFEEAVKDYFFSLNSQQDQKKTREYFEGDEAKELIDAGYEDNKYDFDHGEINRMQFLKGGAGAVAYNLYMLF